MNEHDEYSGIFDHLNPDDFNTETSAIDETTGTFEGDEAFKPWVQDQLRTLRASFAAADGAINPIAILAGPTTMRTFAPDDDETLGQYLDRLGREARRINAHWFFISKRTLVGTVEADRPIDVSDPKTVQQAINDGLLNDGVLWFADQREGGERRHRAGFLTIVGNRLGESVESAGTQTFTTFSAVLDHVGAE